MSRKKKRPPESEPVRKGGVARLKRRAVLLAGMAVISAAGVALFDSEQAGRTFLLVRNLTNLPVTEVQVSGPQGGLSAARIGVAESKGDQLRRSTDGTYTFHIRYKEGGTVLRETDLRILGGKLTFEAIELHIGPEGVTSMARTEDEGIGGKVGRFLKDIRRRLGL